MKANGNGGCMGEMEFSRTLDMAAAVGAVVTEWRRDDGSIVYILFCTRDGLSDAKELLNIIDRHLD